MTRSIRSRAGCRGSHFRPTTGAACNQCRVNGVAASWTAILRGRVMTNSVNASTSLSTVMLPPCCLRDDVVGDRQAEPGALAGRLGGEERLEQLVPDVGRNAGAVVAHADFHRVAELASGDLQRRLEPGASAVPRALVGRVEPVAEQVQQHPRHVLRVDLDRRDAVAEIAFQRDVEALILRARAVIGEVQRLIDQRVEIDRAPLARCAARMFQHRLRRCRRRACRAR